jgi:SAM-dependent methyltransferase
MGHAADRRTTHVGRHYQGTLGDAYYDWQQNLAELGAEIDRFKFAPHVRPGDTVVDFGCGGGAMLASLPAARRIGVEPNPPARAAAERRGLQMHASAADLPEGVADVVISNHSLEHTLAPWDELRALHRALRPGGRLVVWLPLEDWRRQRRPDPADQNHHLYGWTPLLLANLLAEAGFRVLECRVVAHAWPHFHDRLYRWLPPRAFDRLAAAWAIARRQRQLMAVAARDDP